jgi:hypothetical protein
MPHICGQPIRMAISITTTSVGTSLPVSIAMLLAIQAGSVFFTRTTSAQLGMRGTVPSIRDSRTESSIAGTAAKAAGGGLCAVPCPFEIRWAGLPEVVWLFDGH